MPLITYLSDLNMLVNAGGRKRTRDEFERLCAAAGFSLDSVTPLSATRGVLTAGGIAGRLTRSRGGERPMIEFSIVVIADW